MRKLKIQEDNITSPTDKEIYKYKIVLAALDSFMCTLKNQSKRIINYLECQGIEVDKNEYKEMLNINYGTEKDSNS